MCETSNQLTLGELHARACGDLHGDAVLEFSRDVIYRLVCSTCQDQELVLAPVGSVPYARGFCPRDGSMRVVETIHSYHGTEDFGQCRLSQLGVPPYDLFTARCGDHEIGYLIAGDAPAVLGNGLRVSAVGDPA